MQFCYKLCFTRDNNRVETEVNLNGKLEDPEVSTNLTKDTLSVPMNIGKRIINSPSALLIL